MYSNPKDPYINGMIFTRKSAQRYCFFFIYARKWQKNRHFQFCGGHEVPTV